MRYLLLIFFLSGWIVSCSKKDAGTPTPPPPPPPPPTAIQLLSSSFDIGNIEKNVKDSFVVHYNKPVTVNHILLISDWCLPSMEKTMLNGGKTIKFYNLLCGRLGETFRFRISVKDAEGQTKEDTVSFSYYNRKLPVEGEIMWYTISADNKFAWVTTANPNRLVCLGIEDTSFKRNYDLSFKPNRFKINPYNQKIYILPYFFGEPNPDRIYVLNTVSGNIDKTITLQKDIYDESHTHLRVYDIEFGQNGYGVILTGTQEYATIRWRIIDSRINDDIYAHPEWIAAKLTLPGSNYHFFELESCQGNYNGTRIYMRMYNAFPASAVLDCTTGNLEQLNYPSFPNHYIVPSKKEDKLFVASYTFQSIYSAGSWAPPTGFGNLNSETADFSYRPGDRDIMYYRNWGSLSHEIYLLDYFHQQILTKVNVTSLFTNMQGTTDGKWLVAIYRGGLYLWDTNIFFKYI